MGFLKKFKNLRKFIDYFKLNAGRLLIFFAISIIILIFLISFVKLMVRKYAINKQISGLDSKIETLEKQNSDFEKIINSFNDPDVVETEARLRLNLQKEGEKVIIFLPKENNSSDKFENKYPKGTIKYNLTEWQNYIMNRK